MWQPVSAPRWGTAAQVFRVLRPLRSLTVVPEMKRIVNTVLKSVPRLRDVFMMGVFLTTIFGILALHFLGGIFYRPLFFVFSTPVLTMRGTSLLEY